MLNMCVENIVLLGLPYVLISGGFVMYWEGFVNTRKGIHENKTTTTTSVESV